MWWEPFGGNERANNYSRQNTPGRYKLMVTLRVCGGMGILLVIFLELSTCNRIMNRMLENELAKAKKTQTP